MGVLDWRGYPTMSTPLTAPDNRRIYIPEQAPGAMPLNGPNSAYQMGPLSQLAYRMAGSPKRGPLQGGYLPPGPTPSDSGGGGAASGLGGLLNNASSLNSAYKQLSGVLGGGISPSVGSGAMANQALADAGFGGSSAGVLGGFGSVGSGAAANAALAEAGFGGSSAGVLGAAGAAGSALPAGVADAAAAAGDAAAGVGGGASSGFAGAAAYALPIFLAAELGMGFVGSKSDPKAAANRYAWSNPTNIQGGLLGYLGTNGTPKLLTTEGTGSDKSPIMRTLSDGARLNETQWNQLAQMVNGLNDPYGKTKTTQDQITQFLSTLPKQTIDPSLLPAWQRP